MYLGFDLKQISFHCSKIYYTLFLHTYYIYYIGYVQIICIHKFYQNLNIESSTLLAYKDIYIIFINVNKLSIFC